ncbi:hypothetical protein ZHAS_00018008 [Anopheles sinensis]|uniref:Uncharacterized protein n=1 Tax=Anopheles sinensis TaxID=74873 RepID=A0A084WIC6_ANOSI|nr:hypothetical protein ZHAS_00018008 [Anopheles sinensis]
MRTIAFGDCKFVDNYKTPEWKISTVGGRPRQWKVEKSTSHPFGLQIAEQGKANSFATIEPMHTADTDTFRTFPEKAEPSPSGEGKPVKKNRSLRNG